MIMVRVDWLRRGEPGVLAEHKAVFCRRFVIARRFRPPYRSPPHLTSLKDARTRCLSSTRGCGSTSDRYNIEAFSSSLFELGSLRQLVATPFR